MGTPVCKGCVARDMGKGSAVETLVWGNWPREDQRDSWATLPVTGGGTSDERPLLGWALAELKRGVGSNGGRCD